jgi:hypothetical protein
MVRDPSRVQEHINFTSFSPLDACEEGLKGVF